MKTAVRQQRILQELNSCGFVKTAQLAEKYNVSVMTIRRDLIAFSKRGVLTLVRGGAVANRGALAESDYYSKREDMLEAKRNIACFCADLVNSGDSVFLDGGTTTREIAAALVGKYNIVVLTNSINCAMTLSSAKNITTIMVPGVLRETSMAFMGPYADSFIRSFQIDYAFIGTEGVDPSFGASVPNSMDADLKRSVVLQAKHPVLVADSSKLGKKFLCQFCTSKEVELLVTDSAADAKMIESLRKSGFSVAIAKNAPQ